MWSAALGVIITLGGGKAGSGPGRDLATPSLAAGSPSQPAVCGPDVPSASRALGCPGLERGPRRPTSSSYASSELWLLGGVARVGPLSGWSSWGSFPHPPVCPHIPWSVPEVPLPPRGASCRSAGPPGGSSIHPLLAWIERNGSYWGQSPQEVAELPPPRPCSWTFCPGSRSGGGLGGGGLGH